MLNTKPVEIVRQTRTIELLKGEEVLHLLDDVYFRDNWNELYNKCAWKTPFQSYTFVSTWYRVYHKKALPLLVHSEVNGTLSGLLCLARDPHGEITGAGGNLAEYVTWLSPDASDESFIETALQKVLTAFPKSKILLKYIPKETPLHFAKNNPEWTRRCIVREYQQPLMLINDNQMNCEADTRKKRERLNRLKRLGNLQFERIQDHDTFMSVFDELASQFDFRKGALYNKLHFKSDPLRKTFLLKLFEQDLLHATVLKLNDHIIASNVGVIGDKWLHLQGLNSHSPSYAKYSPGIVHFYLLAKLLAQEGIEVFDLTPGGDTYKDRLANDYTTAYHLTVGNKYYGSIARLKSKTKRFLEGAIFTRKVKKALREAKDNITLKTKALITDKGGAKPAVKYWIISKGIHHNPELVKFQQDNIRDLLHYDQQSNAPDRKQFLSDAMYRFQRGEHCYTWTENDILMGCAWFVVTKPSNAEIVSYSNSKQEFSFTGLYSHPKATDSSAAFLHSIVNSVSSMYKNKITAIDSFRNQFKKAGFEVIEMMNNHAN